MVDFLRHFDGSKRVPRQVQREALEWCAEGWLDPLTPIQAISLPVGSGKSAVSVAINLATGGHTTAPSNGLMDQYTNEYRRFNFLKGKVHYKCRQGLTCGEWCDVLDEQPCMDCPYEECRTRARSESTFFNPMSLYYFLRKRSNADLRVPALVVDEAHQLPQMVLQLCSSKLRKSEYGFTDKDLDEVNLIKWLVKTIGKLERLAFLYRDGNNSEKASYCISEMERLGLIVEGLKENVQNFAIFPERGYYRRKAETFIHIRPIRPPQFVMRELLRAERVVALSGSLFYYDLEDLAAGRGYRLRDFPSPIPKERRPLLYRPAPFPMNASTPPEQMVPWIESILDEFPNRNTLIHTTYERAKKMAPLFKREILTNTPETKGDVIDQFKRHGGVWLASGCSEGLDLRDDLCRLNIIPHLVRPNLGDPVVAKRRAIDDGKRWYALETLKTAIQQYGRSTRHEEDHSITVMGDPLFSQLVAEYREDVPTYFLESIQWTK